MKTTAKLSYSDFLKSVAPWFKSLRATKRKVIAKQYAKDTGDNTDITEGLTEEAEAWLLVAYADEIKRFITKEEPQIAISILL